MTPGARASRIARVLGPYARQVCQDILRAGLSYVLRLTMIAPLTVGTSYTITHDQQLGQVLLHGYFV